MLHACVQKFDVTDTVENFLGTKRGLNLCMEKISIVYWGSKNNRGDACPPLKYRKKSKLLPSAIRFVQITP